MQTHEVSSGKRPVGKMTRFSFLPNSAKLTSVVRQSGKSRMTILDFTEQNHVVLDFSGNVRDDEGESSLIIILTYLPQCRYRVEHYSQS